MRKNKPDVEKKLFFYIIEKIFCKAKNSEDIRNFICSNTVNWDRAKGFMVYHDLTPFAYLVLNDFHSLLPHDFMEFLKNNYYCAIARCQNLWQEFLNILAVFDRENIALLPVKGAALLGDIYQNYPIRPMTDIDLLVKESDIKKSEDILTSLKYSKELYGLKEEYWREKQCHIAFHKSQKKSPLVELHWSVDFTRKGRTILPEIWERLRCIIVNGKAVNLLSLEDTIFSLALHNRRKGKTLCLKNSYDLALLLHNYSADIDWDYILSQSRKYELDTVLYFSFSQLNYIPGFHIPPCICRNLNIPHWKEKLIQRFIMDNTFLTQAARQKKELYLKSHFLLYDSLWEPVDYIINIPHEQFAKFYGLPAYEQRTEFLYKLRLIYMPLKMIL